MDPSRIMQIGMGFWPSKTLLAATNLGVFTLLAGGELSGEAIASRLGLHERARYDFLDTLVALGLLDRKGIKESSIYSNTAEADLFLDKNKPTYVGGLLEMCNNRIYRFWGDLEEGLKTGKPQNEVKTGEQPVFEMLYSDPARMKEFIMAMAGIQMGNFMKFAKEFDFSGYHTHCDVGGSGGHLSVQIALNNPHMHCTSFDLPVVKSIASGVVESAGVGDRVILAEGDFFKDPLPKADVITMGNILHDWGTSDKEMLIGKAYEALPEGGSFVVLENLIDDDRRQNAFGLMMSLNMLLETDEGYDFSGADFAGMTKAAGFRETRIMPLTGPASAAIAIK